MMHMTCPLHDTEMQEKTGEYGTYHSHIIPNVGYCNGKKITPFKPRVETPAAPTPTAPVKTEEKVDWDAKDRQSMAQTAMKSASEIVAAQINAKILTEGEDLDKAVKSMANEFYLELKSMKSK